MRNLMSLYWRFSILPPSSFAAWRLLFSTSFHFCCFCISSLSLLLSFRSLTSPVSLPLSYPSLSLFWLQNASLSIFRYSSPLPLISLPLSHLLFFFCRWRTDLQKHSKIHQCCIAAAFWSAWWVTTQPRAIIYKCVFINASLTICKSQSCSVVQLVLGVLVTSEYCMWSAKLIQYNDVFCFFLMFSFMCAPECLWIRLAGSKVS